MPYYCSTEKPTGEFVVHDIGWHCPHDLDECYPLGRHDSYMGALRIATLLHDDEVMACELCAVGTIEPFG